MRNSPLASLAPESCTCAWPFCACTDTEQVLRIIAGHAKPDAPKLPPLNAEQREWCLNEISRGDEYGYDRGDYETQIDRELAKAVLEVWVEYCRDKGLLV